MQDMCFNRYAYLHGQMRNRTISLKYAVVGIALLLVNGILNNYNMKLIGDNADMYSLRYGNAILYVLSALAGIGVISIVLGRI